jgi:hypothetical protein
MYLIIYILRQIVDVVFEKSYKMANQY